MIYLLDTSICIHAMRQATPALVERLEAQRYGDLLISSIALAELEYGILAVREEHRAHWRHLLDDLLLDLVVQPFDADAARAYAVVRQADPTRSRNALDKLIAAQALAADAVLVTANESDFLRVPGLRLENWAG